MAMLVKRKHGLGNLVLLLPVLKRAVALGESVVLCTREEWKPVVSAACPEVRVTQSAAPVDVDLDEMTKELRPRQHRTDEFGELLSIPPPYPEINLSTLGRREVGHRRPVVFAPEAGHPARRWPEQCVRELAGLLQGAPLWLVGLKVKSSIPCDRDLRGRLSPVELIQVTASARCAITMDSAVLQLALATKVPVVAIFGGINPALRVRPEQNATILVGDVGCRPCNKKEICDGRFDCLRQVAVDDVYRAFCQTLRGGKSLRLINAI